MKVKNFVKGLFKPFDLAQTGLRNKPEAPLTLPSPSRDEGLVYWVY
jgi:hypothetical protein